MTSIDEVSRRTGPDGDGTVVTTDWDRPKPTSGKPSHPKARDDPAATCCDRPPRVTAIERRSRVDIEFDRRHGDERRKPTYMSAYEFTCSECGQEIEVNEPMREATLSHGCPVCGAPVEPSNFAVQ